MPSRSSPGQRPDRARPRHHQSRHRPAGFPHAGLHRRGCGKGVAGWPPWLYARERHPAVARGGGRRSAKRFKVEVSPDSVMIMPGGKPTMFMSILMFGEPGAELCIRSRLSDLPLDDRFTGAKPVPVPIREENGFAFSADETLKLITPRTRLLIFNSPANPTGGVTPKAEVDKLVAGLEKWPDVRSCQTRSTTTWSMTARRMSACCHIRHPRQADPAQRLVETYAMTGWRLGYAIGQASSMTMRASLRSICTPASTPRPNMPAWRR